VNVTTRESPNITIERKQVHLTDIIISAKKVAYMILTIRFPGFRYENGLAFP